MDVFGTTKASYSFSEFGAVKEKRGSYAQPFGYTSYQYDNTSNLYFAQARYYDPALGRFVSEDKVKGNIIRPDTINPYIYCLSNPLKYVDRDGQKLFGLEHTYTAEESYEYTPKTPWWSPVIFSNTSSVEEKVYSEGEQGSIFTAYYHESSEKESSSVGFDLASIINVDISLEKATLSVRLCEGLYVNLNLGLEETGLTVTREKDDVEEEFGIVIKIFDGNTYHFSLVGSYSVSETKDNTTKTNTTDFGLSLWFAVGLGWILSNLISGNVPDITQMPQYPLPQPASCSL